MGTKQRQATDVRFEDSYGSEGKGGDDHTWVKDFHYRTKAYKEK